MDDEFNLRAFLRPVLAQWRLILGLGLLAAVAATAIALLRPPQYEAWALVSVAPANYTLRLEGGGSTDPLPARAYPELALTSDLLTQLYTQARAELPAGFKSANDLRTVLRATPASDPALLRLIVEHRDPQVAAAIANLWAELFVARAGQYFAQDQANLAAYEQQLASAQAALNAADAELIAYQAGNQTNLLQAQLDSQRAVMADALGRVYLLQQLMDETQALQARLQALSPTAPASLAEDLALLSIVTRVYSSPLVLPQVEGDGSEGAVSDGAGRLPSLQVQVGPGQPLAGPTVADQQRLAADLLTTLDVRRAELEAEVSALEPTILELQGALAQARGQEEQLVRARDLAQSQYLALATKLQEAHIAAQETSNIVQVLSGAAVPTEPTGPGPLISAVLGGVIGMLVAAAAALLVDYLKFGSARPQPALVGASD